MIRWQINELFAHWPHAGTLPAIEVTGLCLDSRQVEHGDLFVAVQGGHGHGMDYATAAAANGCAAVVYDPDNPGQLPAELEVPVVAVPHIGSRLGELGSLFFGAPSEQMLIAGVTGTNGKTSTAHFIAQAYHHLGRRSGFIGTIGHGPVDELEQASHTTPDALTLQKTLHQMQQRNTELVAMEVSSHALEQGRCETVQFDVGVYTNLSRDHLDYHGDMQAYEASKRRLFSHHAPRFAIINADDAAGQRWIAEFSSTLEVLSYSCKPGTADICAQILPAEGGGESFRLTCPWGDEVVHTGLIGKFNVQNLLAVTGTLGVLGVRFPQILEQIGQMAAVPGRMVRLGGSARQPLIMVDYAHTPDALEKALQALRAHTRGRLICVFGCGGNRDRGKRPLMGAVAEQWADSVVVTSDNPRFEDAGEIINEVIGGMRAPEAAYIEPDRALAIHWAVQQASAEDVVIIAGKGNEQYQQIGSRCINFSDEEQVRIALEIAA
jgi:UDP-N-acetylmuramoyl-L-alanyl-D-glutamate--2,6-diaminopimelate ligase